MSAEKLNTFITAIMSISATSGVMGGASASIFATTDAGEPVVRQLKDAAIAFRAEYRKDANSQATAELSKEIEGALATLQVMSVLPSDKGEQLITDLQDLKEEKNNI
jgi:hypothetical protein